MSLPPFCFLLPLLSLFVISVEGDVGEMMRGAKSLFQ
jgi:hypothetical protein